MAKVVITGGAGFIGSNLAHRLLDAGHDVTVYDDLSRSGSRANLDWLRATRSAPNLNSIVGDVRNFEALRDALKDADRVYHLAGQVAVTDSVRDPRADFEANVVGTFNLLEAVRGLRRPPILIYASTNKVYGNLHALELVEEPTRYRFADLPFGVREDQSLDFHSPYGCSKGAADQYVRDYCRVFGLRSVVMRQSCIYGTRQFGVQDQGWVAWLATAALRDLPITIFGDGKQVRDLLFIDDLLDAYEAAVEKIDRVQGEIYNIGGGPANTISIWRELGPVLERYADRSLDVSYSTWRVGDQKVFVSDIRKAEYELDWRPRVGIDEGIRSLVEWIRANETGRA